MLEGEAGAGGKRGARRERRGLRRGFFPGAGES